MRPLKCPLSQQTPHLSCQVGFSWESPAASGLSPGAARGLLSPRSPVSMALDATGVVSQMRCLWAAGGLIVLVGSQLWVVGTDIGLTRGVPAGGDDGEPHGISNLARAVIAEQAASAAREAGDAPSLPCEAPWGPRHLNHDAEHCTITARCLIVLLKTLSGVSHGLDAVGVTPEMWVLRVHGITLQCGAVGPGSGARST